MNKLFVTDLDGTLLNDDKSISFENVLALDDLRKQGVFTAIATGRNLYSFNMAIKKLVLPKDIPELPVDFIIFSTGAGIMTFPEQSIINSHSLCNKDVVYISEFFDARQLDFMVLKPVPDSNLFVYKSYGQKNFDFQARINIYKEYASPLNGGLNDFGRATQLLAIVPEQLSFGFIDEIRSSLKRFSVVQTTSPLDGKSTWIEVFPGQVSKSQAALWLSNRLGIMQKNVVSIGNDYNDKDLLDWSGKAYVVENCPEDLKNYEVVESNNNCGVAKAAEKV